MEHSPVSIEDLAYHDPNAGENALWNINPPNSKWVSYNYEEIKRNGGRNLNVDEWVDGAIIVNNTIFFIHQLYCVSGKYASSLLRNLFISHGVGETLIINHEHHVQCINLTQILPESPAEIAMPNVLDYMYNKGSFKHNSNEYDDNDVSNNSIRSPLLASTLISAYILRMPELFETAKKQLANIIYDEDNFHKDDITKIEDDLMCLQETVSTKRLKYIMNALCFAKKMHHQNQFNKTSAAASSTTTTTRKVARRVSFSPALNNNNDKNGRKRLDLNILEISNGKNNSNKKKYDSNSSKRRATVSLNSKSKNLSDKDSRNTRRYFSEKHKTYYFVNHVTGETYWDTEAGNSGMAMNEKGSGAETMKHKKSKKTRHFSVVHQKYYIHDEETNETTWASDDDGVEKEGDNTTPTQEDVAEKEEEEEEEEDADIFQNLVKEAAVAEKKRRWTKHFSPEHQQFYLHNPVTKETKWDENNTSTSEEDKP